MTKRAPSSQDYDPESENKVVEQLKKEESQVKTERPDIKYSLVEGLPSGYKLYPPGTKIYARPLKVPEIKALSSINEENGEEKVNSVVKSCIRGIEFDQLIAADKLYLVFWLRAYSFKRSDYTIDFKCEKCQKNSVYTFEIENLNLKDLPEDFDPNKEYELYNGDMIKFKHTTVEDEIKNAEFMEKNKNSLMNFDLELVTLCRNISTINGESKGMVEKYMYLTEELDVDNYTKLENDFEDFNIGLVPYITVKCDKCGGKSNTEVPFRPDFFLPKVRARGNT